MNASAPVPRAQGGCIPAIYQLPRGKAMTQKKEDKLFGNTDYLVKEVNMLVVLGAIPAEFVEFHPDSGITIDYLITSFMEYFPKKTLGQMYLAIP